ELSDRFFGGWKSAANPNISPPPLSTNLPPTHIFVVDWPGAAQSEIRAGCRGISYLDPEKPIADLVGSYFGGSFGSRLMTALRIEKGATYHAAGGFHANRLTGTFEVRTFTKTASTAETLRTLMAEVRALPARPPSADELSLHKRYFLGS